MWKLVCVAAAMSFAAAVRAACRGPGQAAHDASDADRARYFQELACNRTDIHVEAAEPGTRAKFSFAQLRRMRMRTCLFAVSMLCLGPRKTLKQVSLKLCARTQQMKPSQEQVERKRRHYDSSKRKAAAAVHLAGHVEKKKTQRLTCSVVLSQCNTFKIKLAGGSGQMQNGRIHD